MKLTDEDLMLRRAIVETGSLRLAASLLGWPYSRLTERINAWKQAGLVERASGGRAPVAATAFRAACLTSP